MEEVAAIPGRGRAHSVGSGWQCGSGHRCNAPCRALKPLHARVERSRTEVPCPSASPRSRHPLHPGATRVAPQVHRRRLGSPGASHLSRHACRRWRSTRSGQDARVRSRWALLRWCEPEHRPHLRGSAGSFPSHSRRDMPVAAVAPHRQAATSAMSALTEVRRIRRCVAWSNCTCLDGNRITRPAHHRSLLAWDRGGDGQVGRAALMP